MDVLARVQFSKAWLGALFHDFCLMIFVSLFIFHDISSYPMRFFWSLKLSYKNWDLGCLMIFVSGSMGTLLSPCFNASGWPQKKTRNRTTTNAVVKSVGFWTFVWTARGRLHWGSPVVTVTVVTWDWGHFYWHQNVLWKENLPPDSLVVPELEVSCGSWKMGFLVGIFWNEIPVGYDFMF